jgi:hypothetical protein
MRCVGKGDELEFCLVIFLSKQLYLVLLQGHDELLGEQLWMFSQKSAEVNQ